ncbi:Holliday junction resolvase RuvX [Porphyromonas circumdentaria]|uniref:Putative pre-16S rRNA nuclease n=1 Tax=Porphyromonas circumdentaria TaxID=29524 RepID=A0A1T4MEB2_9PORP|nr:Holliday junction resolvase RuvX [Porphyromonas circumdentaria]MBB6275794.1 putative Holliday junction resolvase [Porphyromonas circumdentaria]MDO4721701.1 Holliday junction resolvase RuvX [Porphyromonas circumdentaria]SJZ65221.1 putative holliday junction resolvase [Porphyromonas circumdentaria]
MGRILAIDYGVNRTGLAVTDPLRIIPGGLTTVATSELLSFLTRYISAEKVDLIVVGHPTQMNSEESETMKKIRPLVAQLQETFPQAKVVLYDERFTSKLAQRTILESGMGKMKRRNKALVDEVSAVIILQSYMESLEYKQLNQ